MSSTKTFTNLMPPPLQLPRHPKPPPQLHTTDGALNLPLELPPSHQTGRVRTEDQLSVISVLSTNEMRNIIQWIFPKSSKNLRFKPKTKLSGKIKDNWGLIWTTRKVQIFKNMCVLCYSVYFYINYVTS